MRVVVTGATGNVGSRLVEILAADSSVETVVGVSRREPPAMPRGVDWRRVDVADDVPSDLLRGADALVHLAWLFQPTHRPATTWAANVEGSARLFAAAEEARVRTIVHASSVGAYSPRLDDRLVDESWPTHGVATAAYSREKAYVERVLDTFEARNPSTRVVRLRPAFIFRKEASVEQRRLFLGPLAPTRMLTRFGVPLLPDPGGITFQAVHTDDAAEAYRLAVTGSASGAFNLAAEPVVDLPLIASLLGAKVVKVPVGLTRGLVAAAWGAHLVPASPGLVDLVLQLPLMSSRRARDELGWEPAHDSRAALIALVEGFRVPLGGPTPPLDPASSGPARLHEFTTGVGSRP
jgi:UDP-glucose 4-epimerase